MLDQPTELTPWERDKIRLDFAVFVARRARRYHVETDSVVGVITGDVRPSGTYSPERATEKADATPPAGERVAPSPAPITPETAHEPGAGSQPVTSEGSSPRANVSIGVTGGERAAQVSPETATQSTAARKDRAERGAGTEEGQRSGYQAPSVDTDLVDQSGEDEGEGQPELQVLPDIQASPVGSLRERLTALYGDHPDWTALQFHRAMPGSNYNSVSTTLTQVRKAARQSPASGHSPESAPEPAPASETPPAAIRPPFAAVPSGAGSAVVTKPMVRAPKGTRFHLRDDAGLYLHYSCTVMTNDKAYAWSGTHDQLLACRKKFPLALDLAERPVPREAVRAA